MMRYFTIRRGDKHCLVKQCNNGPRFWLMDGEKHASYKHAKTAEAIAADMQKNGEDGALLTGESWVEETTVVQGGAGVPRFKGS